MSGGWRGEPVPTFAGTSDVRLQHRMVDGVTVDRFAGKDAAGRYLLRANVMVAPGDAFREPAGRWRGVRGVTYSLAGLVVELGDDAEERP